MAESSQAAEPRASQPSALRGSGLRLRIVPRSFDLRYGAARWSRTTLPTNTAPPHNHPKISEAPESCRLPEPQHCGLISSIPLTTRQSGAKLGQSTIAMVFASCFDKRTDVAELTGVEAEHVVVALEVDPEFGLSNTV